MITIGHERMEKRRGFFDILKQGFQFYAPVLKQMHFVPDGGDGSTVRDCLNHLVQLLERLLMLAFVAFNRGVVIEAQLVQVSSIFFAEEITQVRVHQVGFKRVKNVLFERLALYCLAVVACSFVPGC
nr:hypothetical protein [Roseibium marinum]